MAKQEFPYTAVTPNRVESVDASSSNVTPSGRCVGFYVGVTGNVEVEGRDGVSAVFTALPVGTVVPIEVQRFLSAGTTSTDIVALSVGSNA